MEFVTNFSISNFIANCSFQKSQLSHFFRVDLFSNQSKIVPQSKRQPRQPMSSSHQRYHTSAALIQSEETAFSSHRHVEHGQHIGPGSLTGSGHIGEYRFVELGQQDSHGCCLIQVALVLGHSFIVDSCREDVGFALDKHVLNGVVVLVT